MAKLTRNEFHLLVGKANALQDSQQFQVLVCAGTGCVANGSMKVYEYLKSNLEKRHVKVSVELQDEAGQEGLHLKKSGCHGFCEIGPLVAIEPLGVLYTHVRVEDCDEIIEKTVLNGEII